MDAKYRISIFGDMVTFMHKTAMDDVSERVYITSRRRHDYINVLHRAIKKELYNVTGVPEISSVRLWR